MNIREFRDAAGQPLRRSGVYTVSSTTPFAGLPRTLTARVAGKYVVLADRVQDGSGDAVTTLAPLTAVTAGLLTPSATVPADLVFALAVGEHVALGKGAQTHSMRRGNLYADGANLYLHLGTAQAFDDDFNVTEGPTWLHLGTLHDMEVLTNADVALRAPNLLNPRPPVGNLLSSCWIHGWPGTGHPVLGLGRLLPPRWFVDHPVLVDARGLINFGPRMSVDQAMATMQLHG